MQAYHNDLIELIISHLLDVQKGACRITGEMIDEEPDHQVKAILTGILHLSEDLELKESQLRASATSVEKFFDVTLDLVCLAGTDGYFKKINKAFEKVLGYQEQELMTTSYFDIVHPDDRPAVANEVQQLSQGQQTVGFECRMESKDGGYRWFSWNASPDPESGVLYATGRDITEKREAQLQLKEERQRLDYTIRGTNLATWEWNIQTGETIYNERWAEIIGYTLEEISPVSINTWMKYAHPHDLEASHKALEKHFKGESEFYEFETRMMHKNGHWVWVLDRGKVASWTEDGEPLWMFGTQQDITERKRAAQQLEKTNQQLDHFAYIVSHDLKAPLRAINNLSEWIEEELVEAQQVTGDVRQYLTTLRGRVKRMENLINGVLQYSKVGRQKIEQEEVNVKEMITEILDSLAYPDNFSFRIPKKLPVLHTERVLLQQVFTNLLSNAIKYHNREDGRVQIRCKTNGRYYKFSVKDDGPGIEPQYHHKIFGIFQTLEARDTRESTGIGLSIVKKIIQEQGGEIQLESAPGKGSTFKFSWPKKLANHESERMPAVH